MSDIENEVISSKFIKEIARLLNLMICYKICNQIDKRKFNEKVYNFIYILFLFITSVKGDDSK